MNHKATLLNVAILIFTLMGILYINHVSKYTFELTKLVREKQVDQAKIDNFLKDSQVLMNGIQIVTHYILKSIVSTSFIIIVVLFLTTGILILMLLSSLGAKKGSMAKMRLTSATDGTSREILKLKNKKKFKEASKKINEKRKWTEQIQSQNEDEHIKIEASEVSNASWLNLLFKSILQEKLIKRQNQWLSIVATMVNNNIKLPKEISHINLNQFKMGMNGIPKIVNAQTQVVLFEPEVEEKEPVKTQVVEEQVHNLFGKAGPFTSVDNSHLVIDFELEYEDEELEIDIDTEITVPVPGLKGVAVTCPIHVKISNVYFNAHIKMRYDHQVNKLYLQFVHDPIYDLVLDYAVGEKQPFKNVEYVTKYANYIINRELNKLLREKEFCCLELEPILKNLLMDLLKRNKKQKSPNKKRSKMHIEEAVPIDVEEEEIKDATSFNRSSKKSNQRRRSSRQRGKKKRD